MFPKIPMISDGILLKLPVIRSISTSTAPSTAFFSTSHAPESTCWMPEKMPVTAVSITCPAGARIAPTVDSAPLMPSRAVLPALIMESNAPLTVSLTFPKTSESLPFSSPALALMVSQFLYSKTPMAIAAATAAIMGSIVGSIPASEPIRPPRPLPIVPITPLSLVAMPVMAEKPFVLPSAASRPSLLASPPKSLSPDRAADIFGALFMISPIDQLSLPSPPMTGPVAAAISPSLTTKSCCFGESD